MKGLSGYLQFVAVIFSIILTSCEKDDNNDLYSNTCNVTNPAEEIVWLKQEIDNVKQDEYSYYVIAKYKGETVFYYGNCDPLINYVSIVRNCAGDSLGYTHDLYNEFTKISTLWKHENSKCNLNN